MADSPLSKANKEDEARFRRTPISLTFILFPTESVKEIGEFFLST